MPITRRSSENSAASAPPSQTTIALSSVVAILGLIIIGGEQALSTTILACQQPTIVTGVVFWRVRVYRKLTRQRASSDSLVNLRGVEKNGSASDSNATERTPPNPFRAPTRIHVDISSGAFPNAPTSPTFSLSSSTLCSGPKLEPLRKHGHKSSFPEDPESRSKPRTRDYRASQENRHHRDTSVASSVYSGVPMERLARESVETFKGTASVRAADDNDKGSSSSAQGGSENTAIEAPRGPTSPPPAYFSTSGDRIWIRASVRPLPSPTAPGSSSPPQSAPTTKQIIRLSYDPTPGSNDRISVITEPTTGTEPETKMKPRRARSPLKPKTIPPPLKLPPIPPQRQSSATPVASTATTPSTGISEPKSRFSISSVNDTSDAITITYDLQDAPHPSPARSESFAVRDPEFAGSPTFQKQQHLARLRLNGPSSNLARAISTSSRGSDLSGISNVSLPGVLATATRVSATTATPAPLLLGTNPPVVNFDSRNPLANVSNEDFPRLVSVITTFTPSLEDEMAVKVGETVRLLSEFEDGWCLVERLVSEQAPVGSENAMDGVRRGVCPKFCIGEKRV
ncbi:hypothetical protein AX16_006671 [Volvariella volvacea WC 439]|nr:hypothetical protein AX16_006671 [Volvariella volvacea WC 439]